MPEIQLTVATAQALSEIQGAADRFVAELAYRIRDQFRDNVHVITGAMRASASVVTMDESDFAANVAAAAALNPKATFADEVQVGPGEAVVQVPAGYSAFEELGTVHRPAHPALVPAVETVVAQADAIARELFGL